MYRYMCIGVQLPNAICFGEGTIAFSLSLLNRLENEDQVAFVLCHELAHHYRKHADIKVKELTKLNFDKEFSKQVKEIKSTTYGQYTKLKDLMQSLELSLNHHSRENEFEADSIGLQLFLNTPYQASAPVRTMEILDSVDQSTYPTPLDLKKYFNFKGYSYREAWGQYTKSDTWYAKKSEVDSLKTHPSCKKRALALERQLARTNRWPAEQVRSQDEVFNFIRATSEFELVESEYHFKEVWKGLVPGNDDVGTFPGQCLFAWDGWEVSL
jgi:predicted Zn-dependent protease